MAVAMALEQVMDSEGHSNADPSSLAFLIVQTKSMTEE